MAIPASQIWEVRASGNDANGGGFDPAVASPGTDYSQQDAPQVTYTDLVIGATTTQLTSAANPFTAAHVGNTLRVTGGTGFTVGSYSIRSVSGGTATMDRAVGTAASTGGTGNLGGAVASPGMVGGVFVSGNGVWIKSGVYAIGTGTVNTSGNRVSSPANVNSAPGFWKGYGTTRGDVPLPGARPELRAGGASITVFTVGADTIAENLWVSNPSAHATVAGFSSTGARSVLFRCRATGCTSTHVTVTGKAIECDCDGTGPGFVVGSSSHLVDCTARGMSSANGYGVSASQTDVIFERCIAANTTGTGNGFAGGSANWSITFIECLAYACNNGYTISSGYTDYRGCLAVGNRAVGFVVANSRMSRLIRCGGYGNVGGNVSNPGGSANEGFATLAADPFTNAAGLDFSLNDAADGGALLKGIAFAFPGLSSVSYVSMGAIQPPIGESGGGEPAPWVPGIRTFRVRRSYAGFVPPGGVVTEAALGQHADIDRLILAGILEEIP